MIERDVYGLYRESWQGEIVEDAFAHPAKFARGLIRFIYQHAIAQGYIAAGDTVMDPFGGVGLGALDAMRHGLCWRGVELEERFVGLGQDNIAQWNERYALAFSAWGKAQLIQGDSRQLASVLQEAGACVSSPPYSEGAQHQGGIDPRPEHITGGVLRYVDYGRTNGQLGAMPEGVISSPPYSGYDPHGGRATAAERDRRRLERTNPDLIGRFDTCFKGSEEYGTTPGQLGIMPEIETEGETFWTAASTIVEQVHAVLRPGGVAIWVCGDFVRQGDRVYFGRQWMQLCEACGFEPVEWIRAWKREPGPTQLALVGEDKDHTIDRVSFFRRLANKRNPDAAILNEDVIIMRRMP